MFTRPSTTLSVSQKILLIFCAASFIPLSALMYFTSNYITTNIEKENQASLLKYAKAYGLFTYDRINHIAQHLEQLSQSIDKTLPNNFDQNIDNLELHKIENKDSHSFDGSEKIKLSHYINDQSQLKFSMEKIHWDSDRNQYILRAIFSVSALFNKVGENPFTEPMCVLSQSRDILFCTEDKQ